MKSVKHDHICGIFHSGGDHGAAYKNRKGILYFSENEIEDEYAETVYGTTGKMKNSAIHVGLK